METEKKFWLGPAPEKCEFCGVSITSKFYDARIKTFRLSPSGKSAEIICGFACPSCHTFEGIGLGPGKGQEYKKQKDQRWMKTGG